ncbi:rRNA processing protein [Malassezia sp. CBS 17886]|nr:rRNA processing protein [Malassezia sp. CBS 17886]
MARGGKRKAAPPPVDFKKSKQRLGSGRQAATNATDTSFRARTITLPQQSVSVDRTHAPTTRRKQTLQDLVPLTRHHAPGVRRAAVDGLAELADTYPALLEQETNAMVSVVFPLIGDDDTHVRAAVATYLEHLREELPHARFAVFASLILLYTTSALSHIHTAVRLDALRVLMLLLDTDSAAATHGWEYALQPEDASGDAHGQRVLQALFAVLGVASSAHARRGGVSSAAGTAASVDLAPPQRLQVLRALGAFLRAATADEDDGVLPLWCFAAAFSSPSDCEAFERQRAVPRDGVWLERTLMGAGRAAGVAGVTLRDALVVGAGAGAGAAGAALRDAPMADTGAAQPPPASAREQLTQVLHGPLLAMLLDALPSALTPGGDAQGVHADVLAEVLAIAVRLWRALVKESRVSHTAPLRQLLQRLAPHFPATHDASGADGAQQLRLNAMYCELVALGAMAGGGARRMQLQRTLDYLVGLLRNGGRALDADTYASLVPTFWLLLAGDELLAALLAHASSLPAHAPTQPIAFAFLSRISSLHTFATLRVRLDVIHAPALLGAWQAWMLSLPRVLWEAAAAVAARKDASTRKAQLALATQVLAFLHRTAMDADGVLFTPQTIAALAPRLRPIFTVQHPKRGAVPGPVGRLPYDAQQYARAIAYALPIPCVGVLPRDGGAGKGASAEGASGEAGDA